MEETTNTREAAAQFGIALATYRRLVRNGTAPVLPIPGTRRYSQVAIDFHLSGAAMIAELHKTIEISQAFRKAAAAEAGK